MNHKECVRASLLHRQPERTPYSIGFTQKARASMVQHLGASSEKTLNGLVHNAIHGLSPSLRVPWREVAPDVWADEFGVQWNRSVDKDIGVVANVCITPANLEAYQFADPDAPERYERFDEQIRTHPDHFVLANIGFSLFERAWTLAGMETVLAAMVDNPAFVHRLLDRILEYNLHLIANCCRYPIDAMMFGDDWGQQRGVMMGPRLWREFIGPRVRQMYQAAKAQGKFVFIHSCGKVDALFPDLIEAGLDCFNPFQPKVMDVYEMKRRYGDRLSFYGGISTQRTLPYGTPQQTRDEVRRLLDEVGRSGGYIAAPAHAIPGDAKPENVLAMLDVLNSQ